MRNGIPEFRPRQPLDRQLSSATLNDIRRELESLRITRVVNGTFRKLPGGTEIVVAPQSGGSFTPITRQPWDLIPRIDPSSNPENPSYLLTVVPGTAGGLLALNYDEEFSADNSSLYYAKAVAVTDGRAITSITIVIDTDPPEPEPPEPWGIASTVEALFGLFIQGSAKKLVSAAGPSISPRVWINLPANPPAAPGELPFVSYYRAQ